MAHVYESASDEVKRVGRASCEPQYSWMTRFPDVPIPQYESYAGAVTVGSGAVRVRPAGPSVRSGRPVRAGPCGGHAPVRRSRPMLFRVGVGICCGKYFQLWCYIGVVSTGTCVLP